MEDKIIIQGGKPIVGEVSISGGKNPAVAVIPAALLSDDICYIENLPLIDDVYVLKRVMESLGAIVTIEGNTMIVDPRNVNKWVTPPSLVRQMRASYYLIGALLGKFGDAEVAFPGGCDIGTRPMDQHLKGLRALGATIELERGIYICHADNLHGCEIYLDVASVGATVNIMLAAAKANGTTTIVNAAREPHIVDLANFLSSMGARVKGAGTATIRITGAKKLKGCRYSILPDQIETGTWMAIAAATDGDITIRGCVPFHMESVSAKLIEMGVTVLEGEDYLRVIGNGRPKAAHIQTLPYPGFPTDLQQPFTVLLSVAKGTSTIIETIFEARFRHVDELMRMGAQIHITGEIALITGVDYLEGTHVYASDLRAGAALIIAGVMARGETVIGNTIYIDRGYENIVEKLKQLGANIRREKM